MLSDPDLEARVASEVLETWSSAVDPELPLDLLDGNGADDCQADDCQSGRGRRSGGQTDMGDIDMWQGVQ